MEGIKRGIRLGPALEAFLATNSDT